MIIIFENQEYVACDTLSSKDFTGRDLTLSNLITDITIYGTCFSQENPDSIVFPEGSSNITFINCNLDNCILPANSIILGRQPIRFKVQEDGLDWEIDINNNPIRCLFNVIPAVIEQEN